MKGVRGGAGSAAGVKSAWRCSDSRARPRAATASNLLPRCSSGTRGSFVCAQRTRAGSNTHSREQLSRAQARRHGRLLQRSGLGPVRGGRWEGGRRARAQGSAVSPQGACGRQPPAPAASESGSGGGVGRGGGARVWHVQGNAASPTRAPAHLTSVHTQLGQAQVFHRGRGAVHGERQPDSKRRSGTQRTAAAATRAVARRFAGERPPPPHPRPHLTHRASPPRSTPSA